MKSNIAIFCLVALALCSGASERDPFGSDHYKTALNLTQCVNGHKTLKDVQIIYGYGAGNSPGVAAKVEHGDAILGGCMLGRDHWVFCRTCGLRFDDAFDCWRDDRWCSIEELRVLRSPVLQGFPIADSDEAQRIEYFRWYGGDALQGERISFWTTGEEKAIVAALTQWAPDSVKIVAPEPQSEDRTLKSWKWIAGGNSYELNYLKVFGAKVESHLQIEWHRTAEPAGAGQPATKPADKPPAKVKPSPPTPKDVPR